MSLAGSRSAGRRTTAAVRFLFQHDLEFDLWSAIHGARAPFTEAGGGVWAVIAATKAVVLLFVIGGTGVIDAAMAAAKSFKL